MLAPIHRDTLIDLKTEKGGVLKGPSKKEANRKPRKSEENEGVFNPTSSPVERKILYRNLSHHCDLSFKVDVLQVILVQQDHGLFVP